MGRRQFGAVSRLASGRWRARYRHEGVWYNAPKTFDVKAEASAWLATIQTDLLRGVWTNPLAGQEKVGSYAERWLNGRTDIRPTTRAKYERLLTNHILPKLGSFQLGRLAPSDVRSWYMTLRGEHETTSDDAYRLLRAIMRTAVTDGLLPQSPCAVKGAGGVRAKERPVASVAEVTAAVQAAPERFRAALLLCAWCQLRRGEVLGLQRRDVDLLNRTVHIERARIPTGSSTVVGPPKTPAGVRTLTIPSNVIPSVTEHLGRFVAPNAEAWLFADYSGKPISPRTLDRVWNKARLTVGRRDLHLHDLRHTGLTWAAATGASVAELMRRGGHASPQAALKYQHATEDRDRALADAMAALAPLAQVVTLRSPQAEGGSSATVF